MLNGKGCVRNSAAWIIKEVVLNHLLSIFNPSVCISAHLGTWKMHELNQLKWGSMQWVLDTLSKSMDKISKKPPVTFNECLTISMFHAFINDVPLFKLFKVMIFENKQMHVNTCTLGAKVMHFFQATSRALCQEPLMQTYQINEDNRPCKLLYNTKAIYTFLCI